jgi:hypothetical protein
MLESLERMSERLRQPPSISVEVEKLREQLTENKAGSMDLEKLQPSYEMLRQRGEEMIARSEGADKDLSAKGTGHSAGDLSSPCRRVWRRAIHFFLFSIHFCGSQSPSWLFPLERYWLV